MPLNVAEGCRKRADRERAPNFETAACSAREVSAIVDVAHGRTGVDEGERAVAKDRCDHVCAMLHRFR